MSNSHSYLLSLLRAALDRYIKGRLSILLIAKLGRLTNPITSVIYYLIDRFILSPIIDHIEENIEEYILKGLSKERAKELLDAKTKEDFTDSFSNV